MHDGNGGELDTRVVEEEFRALQKPFALQDRGVFGSQSNTSLFRMSCAAQVSFGYSRISGDLIRTS